MAWSYSGDPGSSDRDRVRFLIGDTDGNDQQLQDSEIAFLLEDAATPLAAAVAAVDHLIARYARGVDRTIGRLSIRYSSRLAQYQALRATLAARVSDAAYGAPYAGGISIADKNANAGDGDLAPYNFFRTPRRIDADTERYV